VGNLVTTLLSIARKHRGKVSDKWESYFPVYEALFEPFREKPISLLEIGVQNGGSLEIWAKYLPYATRFVGCDIDPRCGELDFKDPRISVVTGDANLRGTFDRIAAIARRYEIVIDDGSHIAPDVVASFARYFPLLVPGGFYVIEDLHCAYRRNQQSILDSPSTIDFLQLLVDVINCEHWSHHLSIQSLLSNFFPRGRVPRFLRDGSVHSVVFQNSIAVIRRANVRTHRKRGKRVVVGQSFVGCDIEEQFRALRPSGRTGGLR